MDFYKEWNKDLLNQEFISDFLNKKKYSEEVFLSGSDDEIVFAYNVLTKIGIESIINYIDEKEIKEIDPTMIFQFSNFEAGTKDICRILFSEKKALTFDEIGEKMLGERSKLAEKKYGENHSKLAGQLSLVTISVSRPFTVENSSLGNFCVSLDENCFLNFIKILALRNELVKNLIAKAKKGFVNYRDEVRCLSESTSIRRRSNVKFLMSFILKNTIFEKLLFNIIW